MNQIERIIEHKWTTIYGDEWLKYNSWQQRLDDVAVKENEGHVEITFYGCRKEWFVRAENKTVAKEKLKQIFSELGKLVNLKIRSNTVKPHWEYGTYQAISHIEFDIKNN